MLVLRNALTMRASEHDAIGPDVSIIRANCNPVFTEDAPDLCSHHNCVRGVAVNAERIALEPESRAIDRRNDAGSDN